MADVDDCGIRRMFLGYSLAAPAPWLSMATKRPTEQPTSDLSRPVRHVTAPADGAFEAAAPGAKAAAKTDDDDDDATKCYPCPCGCIFSSGGCYLPCRGIHKIFLMAQLPFCRCSATLLLHFFLLVRFL